MQKQRDNSMGIFRLWLNWSWGSSMLVILILVSLWVPSLYMPFVAFGLQFVAFLLIRNNRKRRLPNCYLFPFLISRILFWTGAVMLLLNLLYSHLFAEFFFDGHQEPMPFLTVLIVSPVSVIVSIWVKTRGSGLSFCRDCRMRSGSAAERGFLGMLFTREGRYQVNINLILSSVVTVITWAYYLLLYSDDSLTRPDLFVCFWMETFVWIAMTLYLGMRYLGIWEYYCQNVEGSATRHGRSTLMRYIIIYDNLIAVVPPTTGPDAPWLGKDYYDTPESVYYQWHENVSAALASQYFFNLTNIRGVDIRPFYKNLSGNADCNIFHFFAFPDAEQKAELDRLFPDIEWLSLHDIAKLINTRRLFPLMSAEITRLYNITMAWKTYDRKGLRRYKIKNYRPTFHLEELRKWDIDYNDPTWLYVADNNQDTKFYHFRRFWRNYVNGVGNYLDEVEADDQSSQQ